MLSRDRETGNPLVADTAYDAGLSGAKRARRGWTYHAQRRRLRRMSGNPPVPQDWFPIGTSQGEPALFRYSQDKFPRRRIEDARKEGRTSNIFIAANANLPPDQTETCQSIPWRIIKTIPYYSQLGILFPTL